MTSYPKTIIFENYRYATGETVYLTVYNPIGTIMLNNVTMSELGNTGVYRYGYTTITEGNHLAVFTNGSYKTFNVVRVGHDTTQRVYAMGYRYQSSITDLKVSVFTPDGVLDIDSATMTELDSTGIYYYDYTASAEGDYACYISSATTNQKDIFVIHYTKVINDIHGNVQIIKITDETTDLKLNEDTTKLKLIEKQIKLNVNDDIIILKPKSDKIKLVIR